MTNLNDVLDIPATCHERMEEWAKAMADRSCTPIMALGIGHEEALGEVHLFAPENLAHDDLRIFLLFALEKRGKVA